MFLTPPSPSRTKIVSRNCNEASPRTRPTSRAHIHANHLPPLQPYSAGDMTTPHRGLEHGLPAGLILPDPLRQPQQSSTTQSGQSVRPTTHETSLHTQAPRPTAYDREEYGQTWQAPSRGDYARLEESRQRQEEDRRIQEELKLKQEDRRLEQRKVELEMLREAIAKGVHPNLVPLIFIGLGGAASGNPGGFEMAQQYIAQFQQVGLQVQSQLQSGMSPDTRREVRNTTGSLQYGVLHQPLVQTGASTTNQQVASPAAGVYPSPAYQSPQNHSRSGISQASRFAAPMAAPKPPLQSTLPRLTTNEPHLQATGTSGTVAGHVLTQASSQNTDNSGSPSGIYFHHWQPPITHNAGKDSTKTSPQSRAQPANHDHAVSPRKRKATGSHTAPPPPTTAPHAVTSPTLSTTSSTSKRPGRRRSSVASAPMEQPRSRAASGEPRATPTSESRQTRQGSEQLSHTRS